MLRRHVIIAMVLSLSLSGCGALSDLIKNNVNINGALPLVTDQAAQVDLIAALYPPAADANEVSGKVRCIVPTRDAKGHKTNPNLNDEEVRGCLQGAFQAFDRSGYSSAQRTARRNEIVGELRAASELACTQFTEHLNSIQAQGNFWTGALATSLAGAGAIVTSAATARALAGAAGITSGVRAEFDADFFFEEAAPVIVNAIGTQRETLRDEMDRKLANNAIESYPISTAIADVFRYNNACSLVQGLAVANQSITLSEHPGLDTLNKSLLQANLTRMIMNNPNMVDSAIFKDDGTAYSPGLSLAPTLTSAPVSGGSASVTYDTAQTAITNAGSRYIAGVGAAKSNLKIGKDIDTALDGNAPAHEPLLIDIQGVTTAASDSLQSACHVKVMDQEIVLANRQAEAARAAPANKDAANLNVQKALFSADGLSSEILVFQNKVLSILQASQNDFERDVNAYAGGINNVTDAKREFRKLNKDLAKLQADLASGKIKAECS